PAPKRVRLCGIPRRAAGGDRACDVPKVRLLHNAVPTTRHEAGTVQPFGEMGLSRYVRANSQFLVRRSGIVYRSWCFPSVRDSGKTHRTNPPLDALSGSPFQRLDKLRAPLQPRPRMAPLLMSVGEPQHPVPAMVGEVIARHTASFGRYPPIAGTPEF